MTWLDQHLGQRRLRMALPELPPGGRVLDIGTHDGTLFRLSGARGAAIDPELTCSTTAVPGVAMVKGLFPADMSALPDGPYDAVTALAVIEHVPEDELADWSSALEKLLDPGGRLIITVPAPAVDMILHLLIGLRLASGIEAHQHYGFRPADLEAIFAPPQWRLRRHRRFEVGLNHLYVFERAAEAGTW